MHHPSQPSSSRDSVSSAQDSEQLSAQASARRRALVKGLGKGSAVVVAAAPIKSFATTGSFPGEGICTVSGAMSAVSSHTSGQATCISKPPSVFVNGANWPAGFDSATLTFQALFNTSGDSTNVKTILDGSASDPRRYWVAAFFNARLKVTDPSITFFYSEAEVLDFYSGARNADFLAFLQKIWA